MHHSLEGKIGTSTTIDGQAIGDADDSPIEEQEHTFETLDEPVSTTIYRDLRRVGIKLKHVLIPTLDSNAELREWDLWVRFLAINITTHDYYCSFIYFFLHPIICLNTYLLQIYYMYKLH